MKKIIEAIEATKVGIMLTGIGVLFGCGILVLSGLIDVALKSALQFLGLYVLVAAICCTIESIIELIKNKKEDEEE